MSISIDNKNSNKLVIKDSFCILNSSLRKLSKVYQCDYQKSYFPYKFSTQGNLFYKGITPGINYFDGISKEIYNELYKDKWSFKDESLKYLEFDLLTHYEVMCKANKAIFLNYDIDFTKVYTISGLSLSLFLSKYNNEKIPLINKKNLYNDIKNAYYGGNTSLFKPHGKNLYYYGVNSLYPYVALNDMPGLNCKKIFIKNKDIKDVGFGFFYCIIDSSNVTQKYIGLLPYRDGGLSFPLGK